MLKKYINPYMFFVIQEGQLVLWDYKNHQQFEIEPAYLQRLLSISMGDQAESDLDPELLEANLITNVDCDVVWGWDLLSKIFHVGTQNIPYAHDIEDYEKHIEDYIAFCHAVSDDAPDMKTEKSGEKIILPEPNISLLSQNNFWDVLKNRKTSRSFNGESISIEMMSTILYAVFGNIHSDWPDLKEYKLIEKSFRKSSPSAGGIHSAEAYLLALNIDGLKRSVYHYESHHHTLTKINSLDHLNLSRLLMGQKYAENLSAGIFITARLEKNWHKYQHSRGYSHVLFDIGHLSQTFQLCVTAIGLNSWLTAALKDTEIAALLKVENTTEYPLFFVGVGQGDGHSLCPKMREYLKKV